MTMITHTPIEGWTEPTARERLAILQAARTVAMVGVSSKPERASHFVATYLTSSAAADLEVYFVNPAETEVLGRKVVPSLEALPVVPDIVDVFRRAGACPEVAREAAAVGAGTLWLQLGIWSPEAARIALDAGMKVVMDRCLKIEHARFHGGLHMAGFDTGVISSRRRSA